MLERPIIAVASVGNQLEKIVRLELRRVLRPAFDAGIVTVPGIPFPPWAYDPARRQFHSTRVLRRLAPVKPRDAERLLGVTEVDLWFSNTLAESDRKGLASCAGYDSQLAKVRSHA